MPDFDLLDEGESVFLFARSQALEGIKLLCATFYLLDKLSLFGDRGLILRNLEVRKTNTSESPSLLYYVRRWGHKRMEEELLNFNGFDLIAGLSRVDGGRRWIDGDVISDI